MDARTTNKLTFFISKYFVLFLNGQKIKLKLIAYVLRRTFRECLVACHYGIQYGFLAGIFLGSLKEARVLRLGLTDSHNGLPQDKVPWVYLNTMY